MKKKGTNDRYSEMPADKLARLIMHTHHPYLSKASAAFRTHAETIRAYHQSPDGKELHAALLSLVEALQQHLAHDEHSLFPCLRNEMAGMRHNDFPAALTVTKAGHAAVAKAFDNTRVLSNDYTPDPRALPAVKLCYAQLFNLEQDMLKYIFLQEELIFSRLKK